jgi:hypothetical protein
MGHPRGHPDVNRLTSATKLKAQAISACSSSSPLIRSNNRASPSASIAKTAALISGWHLL